MINTIMITIIMVITITMSQPLVRGGLMGVRPPWRLLRQTFLSHGCRLERRKRRAPSVADAAGAAELVAAPSPAR